ncbi:MAG: hypothetical protein JXB13_11745 [Phycisphaerae bacterium]|nr:hypothetical protein [Phycisphaerae bacterium]
MDHVARGHGGGGEVRGDVLPGRTLGTIREYMLAIRGPIATPIVKGFASINVQLRNALNLYAAVRSVRSMPGIRTRTDGFKRGR